MVGSFILCFDTPDKERLFLCAEDSSIGAYFTALKNVGLGDRAGRDWFGARAQTAQPLDLSELPVASPTSKDGIDRNNYQGQSE